MNDETVKISDIKKQRLYIENCWKKVIFSDTLNPSN